MKGTPPYEPELFQHPEDRNILTQILAHSLTNTLVEWIREQRLEEAYQSVCRSSFLELSGETAPEIHRLLCRACGLFGLAEPPGLYLTRDPEKTVELWGISRPCILLADSFLQRLDERTLLGVLAGQAAGIRVGHHRGLMLSWLLDEGMRLLPVPAQVSGGVDVLLNQWKRWRVYTCDRGALLAAEDLGLALRGMLSPLGGPELLDRLALGTPRDRYRPQAEAFWARSSLDRAIDQANALTSDTAWLPQRYRELEKFDRQLREVLT